MELGILHQSAMLWIFRVKNCQHTGDPTVMCSSIFMGLTCIHQSLKQKQKQKPLKPWKVMHDKVKTSTDMETCPSPGKWFQYLPKTQLFITAPGLLEYHHSELL